MRAPRENIGLQDDPRKSGPAVRDSSLPKSTLLLHGIYPVEAEILS